MIFPSASTYHGAVAHVHATGGGLYFAHGGAWIRLNDETTGSVTKYTAGTNGSSAYTFTLGLEQRLVTIPNFTFYKGHTYLIDNTANVGSHPLQIRTSNGGLLLLQVLQKTTIQHRTDTIHCASRTLRYIFGVSMYKPQ